MYQELQLGPQNCEVLRMPDTSKADQSEQGLLPDHDLVVVPIEDLEF